MINDHFVTQGRANKCLFGLILLVRDSHVLRTVIYCSIYVEQFFFASFPFLNIDLSLVSFHVEYPVAKMIEIIENSYFTPHGNLPF